MDTIIHDPSNIREAGFAAARNHAERLEFLLQYAVQAPSVYNTQPWRFHVHQYHVDLEVDNTRALPVIDPDGRQRIISCGAALYYLRTAIGYFGYQAHIEAFPDGPRSPLLARVTLGHRWPSAHESQVLFRAMPQRHTHREPFAPWMLPQTLLMDLEAAAAAESAWLHTVTAGETRGALADLVEAGDRQSWANPAFRHELAAWLHPSHIEFGDGLTYPGALDPFLVGTFDLGRGQALQDHQTIIEAPVLAVLGTPSDDPPAWLAGGQALAHLLLRAAADGAGASFFNRPIEIPALRAQVSTLIERHGSPQIILRLGYTQPEPPTARRPMADVVTPEGTP
jgi:nitroreductase